MFDFPMNTEARDVYARPLRDLRVSLTDRCNFRCPYCMPKEVFGPNYAFLPASQTLTFEELRRLLGAFVEVGVEKIRFTGGEPLLRPDAAELVAVVKKQLHVKDVALTTNGWMLEQAAGDLRAAGLDRLNVSLDSLDPQVFAALTGRDFKPDRVLRGIEAAKKLGIPIKINMVVQRGVNDAEIPSMARWAREQQVTLRFIEFMDVGNHNGWQRERVVPAREILTTLEALWPLEVVDPAYRGEVASRYRYRDGRGEIGLISAITEPFCRDCNRARLSADGKLFTCLFATAGADLRGLLRGVASDTDVSCFLRRTWSSRTDRYSEERANRNPAAVEPSRIEMSYIGG